jgi:hypothetical protein
MSEKKPEKSGQLESFAEAVGVGIFWGAIAIGLMSGSIVLGVMVRLFRLAAGI